MARRTGLHANGLAGEAWGFAILAGLLGLAATLPLLRMLSRMLRLDANPIVTPTGMPRLTMILLVVMALSWTIRCFRNREHSGSLDIQVDP
jgi:hypothetical protein